MAKKAWKDLEGQYFRIDVGSTEAEALASSQSNILYITTDQSLVMNGEVLGSGESYIRFMCANTGSSPTVAVIDGVETTLGTFGCVKVRCDNSISFKTLPQGVVGIDLSHWYPAGLTTLTSAFRLMTKIRKLDLSQVDVSNVTSMANAFYGMSMLNEIDVGTWDTRKVTSFGSMFFGCAKLTELNLRSFSLVGNTQTTLTSFIPSSIEKLWLGPHFFNSPKLTAISLSSSKWTDTTSINESLYTNLYDRKSNGQPTLKLTLNSATKAVLTDAQKTRLTDYGYTLA